MATRAIFLDRDGVINREMGKYVYEWKDFEFMPRVQETLTAFKSMSFLLIVITNQAGISKGLYTSQHVKDVHRRMNLALGGLLDAVYYSPYHPEVTESLSRKPGTLLFQRALARFEVSPASSWMIGDRERDLIPAHELGISTIGVGGDRDAFESDYKAQNLAEAYDIISARG